MKKAKRESQYVVWVRMAYGLSSSLLPKYRHRNSPKTYTQPQLVAAVMLGFYLDLSYRDLEEWLLASADVCEVMELEQVPDHATLYRTYGALSEAQQRALNQALLEQHAVQTSGVVVDATGFAPTHASQHYISRRGRAMTHFQKGFYVVDVQTQYILGWREGQGPGALDAQYLNSLRRQARPYITPAGRQRPFALLAVKGFDGHQAQSTDFIRPRRGQQPHSSRGSSSAC